MRTSGVCLLLILFYTVGHAQEKLLIAGCNWDKVAIVDKKSGEIEWTHQLQQGDDCNDVEMTKAGNILYAYKGGSRLVTKDQKLLWDFKVPTGQELYTATELPSGEYLLAVCGHPSRIITLDAQGKKVKEQNFDSGIENVHGQFRQVFPTKNGTYLIPLMRKGEVIELSQSSKILRRIAVGGNPFSVKVTPEGNWLVACGDGHKYVIVDPVTERIIKTIADQDIPNVSLLFVAEPHLNSNKNIMIANWNGHSKDKSEARIIEIDAENRVVWSLASSDKITNISTFHCFVDKD